MLLTNTQVALAMFSNLMQLLLVHLHAGHDEDRLGRRESLRGGIICARIKLASFYASQARRWSGCQYLQRRALGKRARDQ